MNGAAEYGAEGTRLDDVLAIFDLADSAAATGASPAVGSTSDMAESCGCSVGETVTIAPDRDAAPSIWMMSLTAAAGRTSPDSLY